MGNAHALIMGSRPGICSQEVGQGRTAAPAAAETTCNKSAARADNAGVSAPTTPLIPDFADDTQNDGPAAVYRFPCGRTLLQVVPDYQNTVQLRLAWRRGKAFVPLLETTPLRPAGTVRVADQTFALTLAGHKRERRSGGGRVHLSGERRIGRAKTGRLCCDLWVGGRGDRLDWEWRVRARGALGSAGGPDAPADIELCLPLAPGRIEVVTLGSGSSNAACGIALWRGGLVLSAVLANQSPDPFAAVPTLLADAEHGLRLRLPAARPGSLNGARARLETWFAPAATRHDAEHALARHVADAADRAQNSQMANESAPRLEMLADRSARALLSDAVVDKRGLDRLLLRIGDGPGRHGCGGQTNAAGVAHALLQRYRLTGDDAQKRRAFLLARGVCEFQVVAEDAPHRGAFWDVLRAKKQGEGTDGSRTLSIATTAHAVRGLHPLHAAFEQDVLARAALAGAQWLLLRQDRDGHFAGERYHENEPSPAGQGSPWVLAEALVPLVETFRRTGSEVFLQAALRGARALEDGLSHGGLRPGDASSEHLVAAIEGVLAVSRESENPALIALAGRLGLWLRARRAPDGALLAAGENGSCGIPSTLAACRAALALARVDPDPAWPLFVLRGLRAVCARAGGENASALSPADHAALVTLPTHLLLSLAARAPGGSQADLHALTLTRAGWQLFAPDPAARDFVQVRAAAQTSAGEAAENADAPLDHLALVCPFNLQVLVVTLAPPNVSHAHIVKNGRAPYVKNLLTGDYGTEAALVPLGDGHDANFGVFLADT